MAKKQPKKSKFQKANKTVAAQQPKASKSFYERINGFIDGKAPIFLIFSFILCVLVSFLLFEFKVSLGGDDSSYISRAYNFIHKGVFPTFQGAVYPIVLSIPVAIFGINLTILKACSLVFILIHLVVFNKALKKIVDPLLRVITIFLIATNAYIAFFASSTYSEALFFMLQGIFILYFSNHFLSGNLKDKDQVELRTFLGLGAILFIMSQTRFVSISAIAASILFFLVHKHWKQAVATVASFVVYYVPYSIISKIFFPSAGMKKQLDTLVHVHPYDYSQGKETLMGYLGRIVDNSNLYLGRTFLQESGLRSINAIPINGMLTLLVYAVLIIGFVIALRKRDKPVIFIYLYLGAFSLLTFVVLQPFWDQNRLIMPMYPFLWLLCLYPLYQLFNLKQMKAFQAGFLVLAILLCLPSIGRTFTKIGNHATVLRKNLNGDKLYGYAPDYMNYIKMAKWAKENLPEESLVACRKPQIAFIQTDGGAHYGVYQIKTQNPDEILDVWQERGVSHIIRASLRKNPSKYTGQYINTIHRIMYMIEQKYPGTFKPIHKEGKKEVSVLFEINYPN